jgi:hypothetical protein
MICLYKDIYLKQYSLHYNTVKRGRKVDYFLELLVFKLCSSSGILKNPRKCFPLPHLRTETYQVSETLCSLVFFRIRGDGQSPKTNNSVSYTIVRILWNLFGLFFAEKRLYTPGCKLKILIYNLNKYRPTCITEFASEN